MEETTESLLNSSSSSSPSFSCEPEPPLPDGEYEVFLSFRGPDVRTTFADCLYACLVRSRIRTFRDEEELRKGEQISPSLVQSIIESKVHIPIFSENYASSKWCLQELAKMVDCWKLGKGHLILPIFYFVNPRDVRHQEGPFKEAFELHSRKHDPDTVNQWREALQEVGKMKGWTVKGSDGQGAIIDQIFARVDSHLMRSYKLVAHRDLVRIDFHVEEVVRLLNLDSQSVRIVSIHGIGGIGKTTLVKSVYDKVCIEFDRCCFVEDVRETLMKNEGVAVLQDKIISEILRHDDARGKGGSKGIHVMKNRVCKHKVLIVLDDVDDKFEFEDILGRVDDFFLGSRFLITTRDTSLNFHQEYSVYELREMGSDNSLKLFSKHAFRMDYPQHDYVTLSCKFVEAAAGVPLALEVIGSLLFLKDLKIWEEKLMQFKQVPPDKVQQRLKISYDSLTYEEQQIFLDIACFFVGVDKKLPIYLWGDCNLYPESGISTLVLRSLIKINEDVKFWMHDHIRDLGRAIVRDENVEYPSKRSRIWANNDALDLLKNREGTEHVRALKFRRLNCDLGKVEFGNLPKLRYLELDDAELSGNFEGIYQDIRWLRLSSRSSVSISVGMNNLVILELMSAGLTDDWRGWTEIKMAQKLKVVILSCCHELKRAPDLSGSGSLEVLELRACRFMSGELNIGKFKFLKELRIIGCGVTKLTGNVGRLKNVKVIELFSCEQVPHPLPELPTSVKRLIISSTVPNLSDLKDLEELRFDDCQVELQIPGDLWRLSKLKTLIVVDCPCESLLMEEGALPSSLNCLHVQRCKPVGRLPSLANLNHLTELQLSSIEVSEIHGLGELALLATLEVSFAPNLATLDGLDNLVLLTDFTMRHCGAIERLPNLGSLKKLCSLVVEECWLLAEIQGLDQLQHCLSHLQIIGCINLANLEGLQALVALHRLALAGCGSIRALPTLSKLDELKTLFFSHNDRICHIEGLDHLISLQKLEIFNCKSLIQLPHLSKLHNLNLLSICRFEKLTELRGLGGLVSLADILIDDCKSVRKLGDLSGLRNLKNLEILRCPQLMEVTGLEGLESLEGLSITGCTSIKKLSALSGLKNLKRLHVARCTQLSEILALEGLELLEEMSIHTCTSIKELPNFAGLVNLKILDVERCTGLIEVRGLDGLEMLSRLSISGCTSIKKLPDLSGLENLKWLRIEGCIQLSEIRGLEGLDSLEELRVHHCPLITKLPDLSGLTNLKRLDTES